MGKFKGYKTYIVAGLAVLGAVAGYLTGDLTLVQAGDLALTAVLGATVRSGINTATNPGA
jgi:hypothetical protein